MSRFFATGTDSESESSSEEEQVQRQPAAAFTFSDDEEETKRVVRSTKEKRYEELTNLIKQIRNHKKIKDMSSMLSSFEDLTRAYQKALPVIAKEESGVTPRFYVRILAELDDFINEVWEDKDGRKNMNKNNSKSLGSMRQKLRKYIKDFEKELTTFREAPDGDDEDEAEEEDVDSDDSDAKPVKKTVPKLEQEKAAKKPAAGDDGDESDDSMDWGSDSDTSSSEDEEDIYTNIRDRFLKKPEKEEEETKREKKERRDRGKRREEEDDGGVWETVRGGVAIPSEKPKMFAKDAEIDVNLVVRKLSEIMAARGKKRTDRREQIELLHELQNISELHNLGPAINFKIRLAIIAAIFDYTPKVSDAMKPEYWTKLLDRIPDAMDVLLANPDMQVAEEILEEHEQFDQEPYQIRGCVLTVVERLDEEFVKLLKECDPHSNEYVQRLKDEIKVTQIIDKVQTYIEHQNKPAEICRIYLRKIEHLYYKLDGTVLEKREGRMPADTVTSVDVMERLCKYVYAKDNTDRLRTRAILCHIYHHALHDNWFEARDLVLMSHLQETIQHSDPSTQILYNRTMANLGLCAFRHANIKDSHSCLVDLMMTGKVKELLAQGLLPQRQRERSKEQEKIEKQRQMPFHMHINRELLECVYLVSAMLIEIPPMAANDEKEVRRRINSENFYRLLRGSERQNLVGPPESMRDHIVAASKAMRNGDWSLCYNFIVNETMNRKVWNNCAQADNVRTMLKRLIQEESLRTYLFTYSNVYDSISMEKLSQMFELDKPVVHSVISKMIINKELIASINEPSQSVVMHHDLRPRKLQSITLQLAEKVSNLFELNERRLNGEQRRQRLW
ncbi:Hypothetical predicted protein [Cloeon dipterum]|uniref:Eukaryotic translation initiation factor 3 subunit C n=1 Tax=Cloeon dipterum TaxID=197152 RepID=A0A8S1BXD4_9INSE|nr:Hypothetical predicted protein [Cloeon dipterum]